MRVQNPISDLGGIARLIRRFGASGETQGRRVSLPDALHRQAALASCAGKLRRQAAPASCTGKLRRRAEPAY
ncbi:hypothetical protein CKO40_14920 [Halochromatium glycolicum]|uniref:Uncharacterized protein n=1 Tax=Halochromatium glycolicum TaxID=85075 RepID=A0AAJ0U5S4_9GAMM|nr:hypothetical protein [Halochromatium glycolicum]